MTGDNRIRCCPECEDSHVSPTSRAAEHDWYCQDCGHKFDEPAWRAAKQHRNGGSTMRRKLLELDPEEVLG